MAGNRVLDQESPDVTPTGAPQNDYQHIETSPAMFGGLIGQATEKLGAAGEQASNVAFQTADFYAKTTVNDALNQYMKQGQAVMSGDPNDPKVPGYLNTTGATALSGRSVARQQLDDSYNSIIKTLPPYAAQIFAQDARRYQWSMGERIDDHANQQFKTYTQSTQKSLEETLASTVGTAPADDSVYHQNVVTGTQKIISYELAQGNGQDSPQMKEHLQQFHTAMVTSRVLGWVNSDPVAAKAFLQKEFALKEINPAQYDALQQRLLKPVGDAAADEEMNHAMAGTNSPAPKSATTPVSANTTVVGDSLGAGIKTAYGAGGSALIGLNPRQVLEVARGNSVTNEHGTVPGLTDEDLKKPIVLSSGASNDPNSAGLIRAQLATLKNRGVDLSNVTVLGVGDRADFQRVGVNGTLKAAAEEAGAKFQPIDPSNLSADRVHPASYTKVFGGAHGEITSGPAANIDKSIPPEGRALLATIGGPEAGGQYNVRYGGAHFDGYDDHPRIHERITSGPNAGKTSDAAGRYQFLSSTWDEAKKALGLTSFSPANQDKAAWWLAQRDYRNATGGDLTEALKSGDPAKLAGVARALHGTWTSLPGGIEEGTTSGKFASAYGAALQGKGASSIASREPAGYNPPAATGAAPSTEQPDRSSNPLPPEAPATADAGTAPPAPTPVNATTEAPAPTKTGASAMVPMTGQPAQNVDQMREAALYALMSRKDLNDQEKKYGEAAITDRWRTLKITAEASKQQRDERNDDASTQYLRRMLKGDYPTPDEIANDKNLTNPETVKALGAAALRHAGGGRAETEEYGRGFWDVYQRANARAGAANKITDPTEIMKMAGPGGPLNLAGAEKLATMVRQNAKSVDDAAVNTAKMGLITYAKGWLSNEQDVGNTKIRDPEGEAIFNSQFIPKFEAMYDAHMKSGGDPWEFLTKKNVDDMIEPLRSQREKEKQRSAALMASLGGVPEPPKGLGVDPKGWQTIMKTPPSIEGRPLPTDTWNEVMSTLLRNPSTETIAAFDRHFAPAGMSGAEIVKRLRGATPGKPENVGNQVQASYDMNEPGVNTRGWVMP